MINKIKTIFRNLLRKVWSFMPGGEIFCICATITIFGLLHGSGVLFSGIVAGLAMVISISCILMAMPLNIRTPICKFIAKCGWQTDIVVQAVLIWMGFTLGGPTLGTMAIFMGINYAGFAALIRWAYFLTNEQEKLEFYKGHLCTE